MIEEKVKPLQDEYDASVKELHYLRDNYSQELDQRSRPSLTKQEHTLSIIQSLKPLMVGAIGEHKVAHELSRLPDDYTIINDFVLRFDTPLYYPEGEQYIYTAQIDHLVIAPSGLYLIETKNWSKQSIESSKLRSPVDQIKRANYALYKLISGHFLLDEHHWGERTIPIYNIIATLKHRPKERFKYVIVKLIGELNAYLTHREDCLSNSELSRLRTLLQEWNETISKDK